MGIHPGFGSSLLSLFYAKEWDKPSYEAMINLVSKLKVQYRPGKICVDGNLINW